jgi:ubiquinone/menaquinone biosynthesis C-methylase UbiE
MRRPSAGGALREVARVLVPGGRLCASVTHPTVDAGRFEAREPGARFVLEALREPGAPPEAIAADPAEERWARVPNFLWLRARAAG